MHASSDKKQLDVGANLFIGNLDENVDERLLYDTFSAFGIMATTAKVARDPTAATSKGYGFVSYTDFESSDAAIESMNGQFLMNKAITVQYAFKKDGKGERHGTPAERLLAAQARKNNALPVASRPPPAPMAFGARPPMPGFQGPYQGQFAGALAAPPPPPGFTQQQTIMPQMQMGMPPPGMGPPGMMPPPMGMQGMMPGMQGMPMPPPPPPGMQVYGHGAFPPPPPGFGADEQRGIDGGISHHRLGSQNRPPNLTIRNGPTEYVLQAKTVSKKSANAVGAHDALKDKRAWDVAIAPAKSLPMQAFMLYMSGGGVQIFSIGIVFMLLLSPFKNVAGINEAFSQYAPSTKKANSLSTLPLQKVVFVLCNLLTLGVGLWKCRSMGLLPTGTGDWLAFESRGLAPELSLF
ncbi:hypothetical protein D9619_006059 [Psilocybe cf. subviscida]|uniref:ER membrane protein complex subunit 4 n=1 Tax=Psilocybe cf. subviscida TaxID=2480587 RepID=A0A8H5BZ30_9AGAR|nr:hypothetical protein D9619_006059 [Psilocybe cf. subviscida]